MQELKELAEYAANNGIRGTSLKRNSLLKPLDIILQELDRCPNPDDPNELELVKTGTKGLIFEHLERIASADGPVAQVTGRRTFNATFDNGTMRNPITGEASTSINEDEYVLPETHFLDIETLKDVTAGELQYVIGNVLRSSRYGAISSRLGRVQNALAAIIFSDTELFSNLELTQAVYDVLLGDQDELDFPLNDKEVHKAVEDATNALLNRLVSRTPVVVRGESLQSILNETITLYRDTESVKAFLQEIEKGYPSK